MTESATAGGVIERYSPELPPKEYWVDVRWSEEHYAELVARYPNQWVAIVNGEVISAGNDLGRVVDEARAQTGRKEFPRIFVERGTHVYRGRQ
jgi:hypothetical protein